MGICYKHTLSITICRHEWTDFSPSSFQLRHIVWLRSPLTHPQGDRVSNLLMKDCIESTNSDGISGVDASAPLPPTPPQAEFAAISSISLYRKHIRPSAALSREKYDFFLTF